MSRKPIGRARSTGAEARRNGARGAPRWALVSVLALALLNACASGTRIQIQSLPSTNRGQSLYVLVRSVEGEELVAEGYEAAARRMFNREADPTIAERQVIIPGSPLSLSVKTEETRDLAVYFFFTEPGDRWWLSIDKKRLPADVVIELGDDQIDRVGIRVR